jgi:histidinol-phosphate aminotransferase
VQVIEPYEPILPFEVLSQRARMASEEIVKLDANENPYGPAPAVLKALANLPFPHIYPDPESRELRSALSAYTRVPMENILGGAGADELIDLVMRLFLDPGDTILHCPPTFGMYAFDAQINAARTVSVDRRVDFSLDLEGIESAISDHRPKLLFLASPNNPDGGLVPPAQLDRLLALPLVIVLDEAYIEFAGEGVSLIQQVPDRRNLIVLRTFSKWAGLAGLRVGYGAFPDSLMPELWKIKQPYNVSTAGSTAALASLRHANELESTRDRIVQERGRLFESLKAVPYLEPFPTRANFILCRVIERNAGDLKSALARRGIFVRYFDKPGLRNFIRVSVGKPEHTDRLTAALAELRPGPNG